MQFQYIKALFLSLLFVPLNLFPQAFDFDDLELLKQFNETKILEDGIDARNEYKNNNIDESQIKEQNKSESNNIFGHDYLSQISNNISFNYDLPVPGNYRIGLNDQIELFLRGTINKRYLIDVALDGAIEVPEIGRLNVFGKTFKDLQEMLKKIVENSYVGVEVDVLLTNVSAKKINLIGAVKAPGAYVVNPFTTISGSLAFSGGLEEYASLREIKLIKSDGTIYLFDLYELLIFGDRSNDQTIESGDTILISATNNLVEIEGEVLRPMKYEYKPDDNFSDLINFALGIKNSGDRDNIFYESLSKDGIVATNNLAEGKINDQIIKRLFVGKASQISRKDIYVRGNGVNERFFKENEFSTLKQVVNKLEFSDNIYPFYTILHQTSLKGLRKESHIFSIADPRTYENFSLKENVEIIFFSRDDIDSFQRYYEIEKQKRQDEDPQEFSSEDRFDNGNKIDDFSSYSDEEMQLDQALNVNDDLDKISANKDYLSDVRVKTSTPETAEEEFNDSFDYILSDPSGIKTLMFGEDRFWIPLSGRVSPKLIFNFFGTMLNTDIEKVSVSAKSGLVENAFNQEFDAKDFSLIYFPQDTVVTFEVEISGQVQNPGKYLVSKATTLNDIYQIAGGLSDRASIEGIFFSRESIRLQEKEAVKSSRDLLANALIASAINPLNNIGNSIDMQTIRGFISLADDIDFSGRLSGNLAPDSDTSNTLYLEKNDRIFVPSKSSSISIIGEVLSPVTTIYNSSLKFSDYIEIAGGLTSSAKKNSMYVIKSDGTSILVGQGFFNSPYYLEPGDTLVVPRDTQKINAIPLVSVATKIISDVAFAAASLNSIRN